MSSLCTVIDRESFSHGRKASDIFWPHVNRFYIALVGKDPRVKGSLWMHFWFVGTNFALLLVQMVLIATGKLFSHTRECSHQPQFQRKTRATEK